VQQAPTVSAALVQQAELTVAEPRKRAGALTSAAPVPELMVSELQLPVRLKGAAVHASATAQQGSRAPVVTVS